MFDMSWYVMTSNSFVTNKPRGSSVESLNNNNARGDMNDRLTMKQIRFVTQSEYQLFLVTYSFYISFNADKKNMTDFQALQIKISKGGSS